MSDEAHRNVGNVIVREAAAERRHRVLAVGHLLDHRRLVEAAVEILLERLCTAKRQGGNQSVIKPIASFTSNVLVD